MDMDWGHEKREELHVPNTSCRYVMLLPPKERCDFIYSTEDCSFDDDHILKPESWVFCNSIDILGIIGMVITLLILFLMISVVADAFVCPNVAALATILHMSENLAGVTILAFGNGAPDIFTELAGAELNHPEILFAGMTGSTLFVSTLVAGLVIFSRPFHIDAWPVTINISFLLSAYTIIFFSFLTHCYGIVQPIAMLVLYLAYIFVTIYESYVAGEYKKHKGLVEKDEDEIRRIAEHYSLYLPPEAKYRASVAVEVIKKLQKEKIYKEMGYTRASEEKPGHSWRECGPMITDFFTATKPFGSEDWKMAGIVGKIFLILQGIIRFLFALLIPVVSDDKPNGGWCKGLFLINMVVYPTYLLYGVGYIGTYVDGIPLWLITLGVGLVLAVVVFFTTRVEIVPRFHMLISVLGFVASILMIRTLANEVVMHLQTIGARFNLSNPLLALTLLSLGNSLGDTVINYGLAKQGMQNMGLAACFGGPMFTCSFGMALISLIVDLEGHKLEEYYGELSPTASLFLLISLTSSLIFFVLLNFKGRSSYGLYLLLLYSTYCVLIVLQEFFIHPFGTQHSRKKRIH